MADALNSCKDGKVSYSLHTNYVGPFNEQAVDAEAVMKIIVLFISPEFLMI